MAGRSTSDEMSMGLFAIAPMVQGVRAVAGLLPRAARAIKEAGPVVANPFAPLAGRAAVAGHAAQTLVRSGQVLAGSFGNKAMLLPAATIGTTAALTATRIGQGGDDYFMSLPPRADHRHQGFEPTVPAPGLPPSEVHFDERLRWGNPAKPMQTPEGAFLLGGSGQRLMLPGLPGRPGQIALDWLGGALFKHGGEQTLTPIKIDYFDPHPSDPPGEFISAFGPRGASVEVSIVPSQGKKTLTVHSVHGGSLPPGSTAEFVGLAIEKKLHVGGLDRLRIDNIWEPKTQAALDAGERADNTAHGRFAQRLLEKLGYRGVDFRVHKNDQYAIEVDVAPGPRTPPQFFISK